MRLEVVNDLFKSYLSGTLQYLELGDHKSTKLAILNGVSQGSILGSVLFILYINDLPICSMVLLNFLWMTLICCFAILAL